MINPVDTSSLLSALPGGGASAPGAVPSAGGFGPDSILAGSLGGGLDALTANLQQALLSEASQALAPKQFYNQKQADEFNALVQDAAVALDSGDLQDARDKTRLVIRADGANAIGFHIMGRIESEAGDLDEAIKFYNRAVELAPGNERFEDDLFVARQLKNGANNVFESAAAMVKRQGTALRGMRLFFELARRSDRAGEAYLGISEGFESLRLPVQQLKSFESVVEEGTIEDLTALEGEINAFMSDNDVPVGLAFSLLGRTQQRLGRFGEAIQSLEQARLIAPETSRYTTELANVYASYGNEALAKGDLSTAKHRFTIAHDLDLGNDDISLGLASVHVSIANKNLSAGLDNDARNNLRRANTLLGGDEALNLEMARSYQRLGARAAAKNQYSLALSDLEEAYEREPDLAGLERQLAEAYRAAGQRIIDDNPSGDFSTSEYEDLVGHYQKAFDLYPQRATFRADLGKYLNDYGVKLMNENSDYEKAVEILKRARDVEPDNTTYLANWQQAWHLNDTNPSS